MSYLNYPRIHFSGTYKANPSTINNTPNNWDPLIYPTPNELEKVELYWNPKGDNGFSLMDDCVVSQVDYADGTSTTNPEDDSIIGQPVKAILKSDFPLQAALVDLDPMQQNVSEIWAMTLQIGGSENNLRGDVPNVAFNGIWQQAQGPTAPHSSASGSAVFQVKMDNVVQTGDSNNSRFLEDYRNNPTTFLSLNINTNAHNNSPQNYRFDDNTFMLMSKAGVPSSVLAKMIPMKSLSQNSSQSIKDDLVVYTPIDPGDVPTLEFVKYMLSQYLKTEEFNANIDKILDNTIVSPYVGYGAYDFLYGMITGTAGPSTADEATYFVPSRVLVPSEGSRAFNAPFTLEESGIITLNLGNSLPTNTPGNDIYLDKLGTIWLVAFPNGDISVNNAIKLVNIPIDSKEFIGDSAGFFSETLDGDWSETPLGIISVQNSGITVVETILLAEEKDGYFMRADQFAYRMNPGYPTTSDFSRGSTNNVHIHALKFGRPVADNTEISLTMKDEIKAIQYTVETLGTSGTLGVKNLSVPQDKLKFPSTAATINGIATFEMTSEAPGNPRHYIDGQVYFLDYNFVVNPIIKDINDIVSVMVYDHDVEEDAQEVLAKFGRLFKIMGFLTDEEKVFSMRNMIKTLLEKPMSDLVHMPVTRDLSVSARNMIVAWVDKINRS